MLAAMEAHSPRSARRRTVRSAILLMLPVWLVLATAADAATLTTNTGGGLIWSATTGANVTFYRDGSTFRLLSANEATTIGAGTGCTPSSGSVPAGGTILCPLSTAKWQIQGSEQADLVDTDGPGCTGCVPPDKPMVVNGLGGDDNLEGGSGNDIMSGGLGNDLLRPGAGNDNVHGDDGNDFLASGSGRDGADVMDGDAGFDTASYATRGGVVTVTNNDGIANDGRADADGTGALGAGPAADNIRSAEEVRGGAGADTLDASAGGAVASVLNGGAGNDRLFGSSLDDVLIGGSGADTMDGNAGTDTVSYADHDDPLQGIVEVTLDGVAGNDGNAADGAPGARDTVGPEIESVTGSPIADSLIGDDLPNGLDGGGGNDTIDGRGAADALLGGDGDDTIQAVDGVQDGTVDCGPGTDTAFTDANDPRVGCELPAAVTPTPTPTPTPPPPPKELKTMAVTVGFNFFPRKPKKTTRFTGFVVKNIPKGSKVVAKCVTKKGKRCKGKFKKALTKKGARGTLKIKVFNKKKYRAGNRLEVAVSNPDFRTQIKIVKINKNRGPSISTRCQTPPSKKRTRC